MVRSLVSASAAIACSWSVLFGLAHTARADVSPLPKSRVRFDEVIGSPTEGSSGASVFYGLIEGNGNRQSGYVRIVVNRSGRGSALLSTDGVHKRAMHIGVDEAGNLGSGSAETSVSGQLVRFSDDSVGFNAVVNDAGQQLPARVLRAEPPENFAEAVKGKYTVVFENSTDGIMLQGGTTGFGTLRVSKVGGITFTGRLSDGSTFSQGSKLNSAGKWPLYSRAASGAVLSGAVSFANQSGSDCNGTLRWERRIGQMVGAIQSATIALRGSLYIPADALGSVSQWTFDARKAMGYVEASSILKPSLANALKLTSGSSDKTRLALNKGSGLLSGTFLSAGSSSPSTAKGVIFQKTNQGFGLTKQPALRASAATIIGMPTWAGKFMLNAGSATMAGGSSANTSSNGSGTSLAPVPQEHIGSPATGGTFSFGNPSPVGSSRSDSGSTGSTSLSGGTISLGTSSGGFTSTGSGTLIMAGSDPFTYTGTIVVIEDGSIATVASPSYTPPTNETAPAGSTPQVTGAVNFIGGSFGAGITTGTAPDSQPE